MACGRCGKLNDAGARFCSACGAPFDVEVPERRKLATLLFCDVSGSTAQGERVDAESVRDLMFRYFYEMRSAIERHGGTVEKFAGDAVMAVFGIPVAHEDDALRAVRAAVEMCERLVPLNEEFERSFGTRIAMRIGVNTGEVVSGDVTSREILVTGDAVNVAARLEQAAEAGEILIGEQTLRLTRHAVSVEPVGPLELRGKGQPVAAYRVVDVVRGAPAPELRLAAELVGRDSELGLLHDAFAEVLRERECRLVTIVGEPGVGKSRLVAELVRSIGAGASLLSGRCLAYGDGITYWALGEIVRQAAGIRDEDSAESARDRLNALVSGRDGAVVSERVAQAIGLASGQAAGEEIAWAVRRLLQTLATRRPHVLVLDDIHWAEPAFVDVVASLTSMHDAALLVVCLARPELLENRPEWTVTVRLEPLDGSQSGRLIQRLLQDGDVPDDLLDGISHASGGNPLFVEELVAMLVETGELERRNGRWVARQSLGDLDIPATLSALLGARLDRLAVSERAAAERGSIEGELFHRGAVVELSPPDARREVPAHLETLASKEFIRPGIASFADEAAFRFRHILIRDAAYRATAKKLRAELHERFTDWLERKAGDRLSEYEEIVGHHLEQAYRYRAELGPVDQHGEELAARAANRLASAGRSASDRGDMPASAKLYSRAEALLPSDAPQRIRVLTDLGEALIEIGDFTAAQRALDEADERAEAAGDETLAALAVAPSIRLVGCTTPMEFAEKRPRLERAMAQLEAAGEDRALAYAYCIAAEYGLGAEAPSVVDRALDCARRAGAKREEALLLVESCWIASAGQATLQEGIRAAEAILEREQQPSMLRAHLLDFLAGQHARAGHFDAARRLNADARVLFEEFGSRIGLCGCLSCDGYIELSGGSLAAAEQPFRAAYEAYEQIGDTHPMCLAGLMLSVVLTQLGRAEEADKLQRFAAANLPGRYGRYASAMVLCRESRYEEAELEARAGLADAHETGVSVEVAFSLIGLAEVFCLAGRSDDAVPLLEEAVQLYELKGWVGYGASRARALLEELRAELPAATG